jgi:hypothetical protein
MRKNQLPMSAARWQHVFCDFNLMKNHKNANNPATSEARDKNKRRFGILGILKKF